MLNICELLTKQPDKSISGIPWYVQNIKYLLKQKRINVKQEKTNKYINNLIYNC